MPLLHPSGSFRTFWNLLVSVFVMHLGAGLSIDEQLAKTATDKPEVSFEAGI